MQDGRQRQDSPLQRLANSALPPLSKYYYGPAQVSPRGSPANDGTAFNVPPNLPPRRSPGPPNYPPRPGTNPSSNPPPLDAGQTWQNYFENLPGFQPSAPPASQFSSAPYNPNTYGLMPSAQQSPVHPAFRQPAIPGTSSDTSTWGLNFNSNHGVGSVPPAIPPQLPPRPHTITHDSPSQTYTYSRLDPPPPVSQIQQNAEILQPVAYNSQPLSVPQGHPLLSHNNTTISLPRPESTTLPPTLPPPPPPQPPPHPPKLHQAYINEMQSRSQARASCPSDPPQTQTYHHETPASHEPSLYQQPSIGQGQQNGATLEEISHRVQLQDQPTYPPPHNPHSTFAAQNNDFDRSHVGQLLHQSSISPVGSGDDIRWVPETNQWESRTSYIPSPQLDHAALSQRVRNQSMNNTQVPSPANSANQQVQGTNQTLSNTAFSQRPQTSMPQDEARPQDASVQEPETNNSFYWHSPHSSSDTTNDHSQTFSGPTTPLNASSSSQVPPIPTSAIEQTQSTTYSQTTNMYHSDLGIYSASALGFGGPSDWEHFGDYEAEEVDDTDLYSRAEPPSHVPVSADFAELPADSPPPGGSQQLRPVDLVVTASAGHDPASLPTDSVTLETSLSAARSARNREAPTEVGHESMPNHSGMQAQTPSSNETDKPGLQSERSSSDPNKAEATIVDETIQAWSHAPDPQAQRSSSPAISNHSSQMKPINEVYTSMQSDRSRPASNPESPLRHPEQLLKTSDRPANTMEKQHPGHDFPVNEDQVAPKHIEHPNPIPVSQAQHDICHSIPPSHDGSPLVSKDSPDQRANRDMGASDAASPFSLASLDQKSVKRDIPQDAKDDIQRHLVVATSPSLPSKKIEASDPYANLDPWAKASLNRYVVMLREEAQAETDKDKFKIFEVFISRETRLRAVLYETDADPPTENDILVKDTPTQRINTANLPHASKALPALPADADGPPSKPALTMVQQTPKPDTTSVQDQASNLSTGDQSYIMVDLSEDVQYSPGGRPIVSCATNTDQSGDSSISKHQSNSETSDPSGSGDTPGGHKPAYTPFRYSQPDATNLSTKRQSYRPYAALKIGSLGVGPKTSDQTDDRSTTGIGPAGKIVVGSSNKIDGDIVTEDLGGLDAPAIQHNTQEPLDLRRFEKADFDPLVSVLPRSGTIHEGAVSLQGLKRRIDAVPDDFSFIHQSVVAWDAKSKKLRENHDKARHVRQIESEQRIDALFDDHEIGYGDISELESEFKQSEAATKADEDRLEYQTFVTEVFDLVWTRLHFEIDQLTPLYTEYTDLLNETLAGKDMFDGSIDRFTLAPTMDSLLALHQKLEIRHQKAFESVLERDRRLKKTELSPWYSLGNVTKVKQLEKQFEQAEKRAIVDYCHQRDVRANKLMDSLDQNTLRGVGANQDYMELIHRAICRVASQRAFASAPNSNEPEVGLDEVMRAKAVTAALATSSEQIVQTFHVADMLLNAADYEVSVATAKLANADPATFRRLSEEKAKEDHKLLRDLEHRLALIREDSRKTNDEIVKLLCFLGVQNGHAEVPQRVAGKEDPGHQERLQKALEEAKRRNASKEMHV